MTMSEFDFGIIFECSKKFKKTFRVIYKSVELYNLNCTLNYETLLRSDNLLPFLSRTQDAFIEVAVAFAKVQV